MATIDVEVTGQREIHAALQRLLDQLGTRAGQTMTSLGDALLTAVDDEFATSGHGEWAPHSPVTIAIREAAHRPKPYRLLILSSKLRDTMQMRVGPLSVSVGTNVSYAPLHQQGGRSESGATVPARPFLVVREDTKRELIDTIEERLAAAWDDRPPRAV